MIQQRGSSSISMSQDDLGGPVEQYLNQINNNQLQVHRPNEDQVLAFLDCEALNPRVNHFHYPESNKDIKSKRSQQSKRQLIVQPSSNNSEAQIMANQCDDGFIPEESPILRVIVEQRKTDAAADFRAKTKIMTMSPVMSSKSPRRKSKLSKIFAKFTGKMYIIKRFVQKLQRISPFHQAIKLTSKQLQLLQDVGSDCQLQQKMFANYSQSVLHTSINKVNKSKNKIIHHEISFHKLLSVKAMNYYCSILQLKRIFIALQTKIINPQGTFLVLWESLLFMLTLLCLYTLSIQLIFKESVLQLYFISDEQSSKYAFTFLLIYYLIDIILGFKTGYYIDGEVVMSQSRIARRYLKTYFIYDLITIIPLIVNIVMLDQQQNDSIIVKLLNLLTFVRVHTLNRIYSSLEGRLLSNPRFVIFYRFLSVLGMVFLYAHVFGCLWYVVGSQKLSQNWINRMEITDEPWYVLYSYSIYWSVMTMTTVGYGDITPQNYIEALFCVGTMFIASIIFAYSLNTIGMILNEMQSNDRIISENMAIINRYMRRKNLNAQLQFRVRQFLKNLWTEENKFRIVDENKIINRLSSTLQQEIQISLYGKFISSMPIMYKYFSQECLLELTKSVQEYRVPPKTYVVENGSIEQLGLYSLVQGEAEMIVQMFDRKYKIGKLKKGDIFGHSSFFHNRPYPYGVKTTTVCSFAYLSQQSFLEVLRSFPSDYQVYRMLMDSCLIQQQEIDLGVKCMGCDANDHDIDVCPYLHLRIKRDILIQKYLYSTDNERQLHTRNNRRSTNARFGQKLFEDAVSLFQENNASFCTLQDQTYTQQDERSQIIDDIMKDYKRQQPDQKIVKQQQGRNVRFRKRSKSLNSIDLSDEDGSHFQKSMSAYKSHESKNSIDQLSGITPKLPGSYITQSSLNILWKENSKRKSSRQQDSEPSNNQRTHQIQKSNSQSSSGGNHLNHQTSGVNAQMNSGSPKVKLDDKSFQTYQEDSIQITNKRRRRSQIGDNRRNPLTAIPSVCELNESEGNHSQFSKARSANMPQHQHDNHTLTQRSGSNVKKQHEKLSQNYRTDTYKQFMEHSPDRNFEDLFDKPIKLNNYFPLFNKEKVIEKYQRYQIKRLTFIQQQIS